MLLFGFFQNHKEFYRTLVGNYDVIMSAKRAERDIINKQKRELQELAKKQKMGSVEI